MTTSRVFAGRPRAKVGGERVPPRQYLTDDFLALSAGTTPRTPLDRWTLALQDGGSLPREVSENKSARPRNNRTQEPRNG